jgi:drug/metabolite transporter (DMT)-like permease
MNSLTLILISCVLTAAGQIAFKAGMQAFGDAEFSTQTIPRILWEVLFTPTIVFGFMAFGLGAVFWLFALARSELSYAVPVASLTYVLILIAGVLLFKEPMTVAKLIGTTLVAAGVVAISWK